MPNKVLQVLNRLCFAVSIPLISIIHVVLNNDRSDVHILRTVVDSKIPFNAIFAVPYLYWFAYVFIGLLFFAVVDCKAYFRLLMSIVAGMLTCFIIYYFYQTTVPRPEVIGEDVFSNMVRFIYSIDKPFNCFPSIHVLNALLVSLFLYKFDRGVALKIFAGVSFVLITLSTMYIKQHYVLDAAASILLGLSVFTLFTNDYLWSRIPVRKVVELLIPAKVRENLID